MTGDKLSIGALVRIDWLDICGSINSTATETNIVPCATIGVIWEADKEQVKLCTSLFNHPQMPDSGDFTAIPIGVIKRVTVIRKQYQFHAGGR